METLTSAERLQPAAQNDFCGVQRDYYTNLSHAVASTAEIALRDAIAAGEVQTLQEAVQELRCIRDEIITAVGGKEVEQNG